MRPGAVLVRLVQRGTERIELPLPTEPAVERDLEIERVWGNAVAGESVLKITVQLDQLVSRTDRPSGAHRLATEPTHTLGDQFHLITRARGGIKESGAAPPHLFAAHLPRA
jgi:hypothetical protein